MQKQFMPEDTKVGIIQAWLDDCTDEYVCFSFFGLHRLQTAESLDFPISRCKLTVYMRHEYEEPKQWEIKEINSIMNTCIAGWGSYR